MVFSSLLGGILSLPVSSAESSTVEDPNTWRTPNSYLNPLLSIPTKVYDFELYEDFVIIGADNGIQIYPLQEIQNVSKVTTIPLPGAVIDILIIQDILIALCDGFGIAGINLQDLEGEINPIYLELEGDLNNLVVEGEYLYVSCGEQGITAVQMSQIDGNISEFSLLSIFLLDNLSIYDIEIENGKLFSITRQIDDRWSYHLVIIDYTI